MKKEKWIDILFWSFIFIGTIFNLIGMLNEANMSLEIIGEMIKQNPKFVLTILGYIVLVFVLQFVQNGIVTIGYIAYKVVNSKHKKERMDKIDFENDTYYREIIPKYSVAVLSYIDDYSLEEKDVCATILSLKLNKYIEINDDGIEIIKEPGDLPENELYIYECIKRKRTISLKRFERDVIYDANKLELLGEKFTFGKKLIKTMVLGMVSFILGFVLLMFLMNNTEVMDKVSTDFETLMLLAYFIFIIICWVGFPAFLWIKFFIYISLKTNEPYLRTKKGKEINKKIEGLRKYFLDYSLIENKDKDSLVVWEDYLVYSVMLGINKKILEEIKRFIEINFD